MNENRIEVFTNAEFGSVRTLLVDGEPYFVGKDVAEILGYTNSRKAISDHVDEEDKTDGVTIRDSIGREQNPICINESGLYSLILSSKLPTAKKFKRWVTNEVLPSIRKTGGYNNISLEEVIVKSVTLAVSETVKAMIPFISSSSPVKAETVPTAHEPVKRIRKTYKYVTPSKISMLSPELKDRVDEMIISGEYSCQQIANFIMNNSDIKISQMAVNRYKRFNFTNLS